MTPAKKSTKKLIYKRKTKIKTKQAKKTKKTKQQQQQYPPPKDPFINIIVDI